MENVSRRGFVAGLGGAALAFMPGTALAHTDEKVEVEIAETTAASSSAELLAGTSDATGYDENPGIEQTMTLEEINAVRREIVDRITEDHIQDDGTVIPAVYVKVRELINTFSVGIGYGVKDGNWDQVMHNFSEEEAQAYLEMPWGVLFSAQDFAAESGRSEDECEAICYELSTRGLLYRCHRANLNYYHVCGYFHGIWEFGQLYHYFHRTDPSITDPIERCSDPAMVELCDMHVAQWGDMSSNATATAFFYPHPVGQEVIKDGEELLTYDDWRAQIERNTIIGVSPCQCRIRRYAQDAWIYDGPCEHPLETCMSFGEMAEYYIENGVARQIDQQEAMAILEDVIDRGMVIQSMYSKAMEVICCCHGDCCDILSGYVALGEGIAEGVAGIKQMNLSHYLLEHDREACIQCGACVDRCPVFAISMGEDGYPEVSATCVRCGQCGLVCPVGARKLTAREEIPYLPATILDDYNLKASDRMSHGWLK